jgi:hypothetical protein
VGGPFDGPDCFSPHDLCARRLTRNTRYSDKLLRNLADLIGRKSRRGMKTKKVGEKNTMRLKAQPKSLLLAGLAFVFSLLFFALSPLSNAASPPAPAKVLRNVSFELDAIEDATSYEVEITKPNGKLVGKFPLKKPVFSGKLAPGKFRLRSRSTDSRGVSGEWSDYEAFEVLALAPTILQPVNESKPPRDAHGKTQFVWEAAPGAERYQIEILSESDGSKRVELVEGTRWSAWVASIRFRCRRC